MVAIAAAAPGMTQFRSCQAECISRSYLAWRARVGALSERLRQHHRRDALIGKKKMPPGKSDTDFPGGISTAFRIGLRWAEKSLQPRIAGFMGCVPAVGPFDFNLACVDSITTRTNQQIKIRAAKCQVRHLPVRSRNDAIHATWLIADL